VWSCFVYMCVGHTLTPLDSMLKLGSHLVFNKWSSLFILVQHKIWQPTEKLEVAIPLLYPRRCLDVLVD